jgi:lauroyl/myristoyl acyltransferase
VYHIFKYRKKVVLYNLDLAFPEKSFKEKKQISQLVRRIIMFINSILHGR